MRNQNIRVYDAYGVDAPPSIARTGYAGQVLETGFSCHLLGDRLYSPVLRRFLGADAVSPFGQGGLNRYAYCGGDPINRIDPRGMAWQNWHIAGIDTMRSLADPTAATSESLPVAMSTPSIVSMSVAAAGVNETPGGSLETRNDTTGDVFGWMSRRSGSTVTASAVPQKALAQSRGFVGGAAHGAESSNAPRGSHVIDVVERDKTPPDRFRYSSRSGSLKLKTHWHVRADPLDANVSHWGADTTVTTSKLASPLRKIGQLPIANGNDKVYMYSGVHGNRYGRNWDNGQRRFGHPRFYRTDNRRRARYQALLPERRLHVENIADISREAMIEKMARPGVHLHAYCFGAVDDLMLDVLDADPVSVYL